MKKHVTLIYLIFVTVIAAAYLLFLYYALQQMKTARADGLAKIDSLLDQAKTDGGE